MKYLLLALLCASAAWAGAPVVHAECRGPALFAVMTTATDDPDLYVIGYRAGGALAGASHVNAYLKVRFEVVRVHGSRTPRELTIERSIPIARDGAGYLSRALTLGELFDLDPGHGDQWVPTRVKSVDLAYFVDGRWDSNWNRNYPFAVGAVASGPCVFTCASPAPPGVLPAEAKAFLSGLLR